MFTVQRADLVLQFLEPVFKEDKKLRIGYGHELFGLGHLVHQSLAHLRWVDTFAHAFGKSEMNHAGNLILAGFTKQTDDKTRPTFLTEQGEQLVQGGGGLPSRFFRVQPIENFFYFIHNKPITSRTIC